MLKLMTGTPVCFVLHICWAAASTLLVVLPQACYTSALLPVVIFSGRAAAVKHSSRTARLSREGHARGRHAAALAVAAAWP